MTSESDSKKYIQIEKLVANEPFAPEKIEEWASAVDLECTGMDDHDDEECRKCWRLRRRIAKAIQCAMEK